jgi:hypothetical protein
LKEYAQRDKVREVHEEWEKLKKKRNGESG